MRQVSQDCLTHPTRHGVASDGWKTWFETTRGALAMIDDRASVATCVACGQSDVDCYLLALVSAPAYLLNFE